MFYKVSDKQILTDRNNLFKSVGVSALEKNGFLSEVFNFSWNGQYDKSIGGYIYQFYRLKSKKYLESIDVYVINGEKWIQIYLNVFLLSPELKSITELSSFAGLKFGNPPNSLTRMRLRIDDYKGPPLFYMLFLPEHKIGKFYTKVGYLKAVERLSNLIKSDMENIDDFVKRWHKLHKPNLTDWEGNKVQY